MEDIDNKLKKLYELSMLLSGEPLAICRQVACMIGDFFNVRVVCLSEIRGDELYFITVYVDGEILDDAGHYPLNATPCANVDRDKDINIFHRVSELFPHASFLKTHNAFSYCGFPALDNNGNVIAVTCLLDDKHHEFSEQDQELLRIFGQRIAMELERKANLESLNKAEQANLSKSKFLSSMSHELRTPMNAILGFGQLLQMNADGLEETQRGHVKEILDAGYHLLNLINEILDLSRIESGKMEVSIDEVHVDDVLQQCIALIGLQAEARQLELIDHVSNKGYTIYADTTRLKQVLLNLLSNAVKYNCEQGRISLNSETVDNHRLRISITDTGKGLTEDGIAQLFTPFERLNAKNDIEGTGIGLVITKYLVELMDGTMGVESILGEGCTFWFELNCPVTHKRQSQ